MKTAAALPRDVAAQFAALRRKLDHAATLALAQRIEMLYRERFDLAERSDDEIVVLTLSRGEQTSAESAALRVVRACIGVREAEGNDRWLDLLQHALYEADDDKILGVDARARVRAGGAKTAAIRKKEAHAHDEKIKAAAQKLRAQHPGASLAVLARILSQRNLGGATAIRKKLTKLLP